MTPFQAEAAKPCRYFLLTGQCRFGEKCRFSHDLPNSRNEVPAKKVSEPFSSQSSHPKYCKDFYETGKCARGELCSHLHVRKGKEGRTVLSLGTYKRIFEERRNENQGVVAFRHMHEMRKFVLSMLMSRDKSDVVIMLGNPSGIFFELFQQILQYNFDTKGLSFQRIILPLCCLLTENRFANSIHISDLRTIYVTVLKQAHFFPRVLNCLQELLHGGRFEQLRNTEKEGYLPETWQDCVLPVTRLILLLLTQVHDAPALPCCVEWVDTLYAITNQFPSQKQSLDLRQTLRKCRDLVQGAREHVEKELRMVQLTQEREDELFAQQLQMGVQLAPDPAKPVEGPGDLRPSGPRHDNDHADFRNIQIHPTEQEILSRVDPYLPAPDGSEHVAIGLDRHLDIQFRLLRQDMLCATRRGVLGFLEQDGLSQMTERDTRFHVRPTIGQDEFEYGHSNSVHLLVFRHMKISGLMPTLFRGAQVDVEFDQIGRVAGKKKAEREKFWKDLGGSRQLQQESLVCLALGIRRGARRAEQLIFAKVADKNRLAGLSNDSRCTLRLSLLDTSSVVAAVDWLGLLPDDMENILLQVQGHFFPAYENVLRALQSHSVQSLSLYDSVVPLAFGGRGVQAVRPCYLQEDSEYDLSLIYKSEYRHTSPPLKVPVGDYEILRSQLHDVKEKIVLENVQIDAFANALTRELSLIQGPPGTGKTYVGIHIVRALLANCGSLDSDAWVQDKDGVGPPPTPALPLIRPILCICYTNHALDQFLEGLIDGGIDKERIIRVGGRSKSEILKDRVLIEVLRSRGDGRGSIAHHHRFLELKKEADDLDEQIKTLLDMITRKRRLKMKDIGEYLEARYPNQFYALFRAEEGFEFAGGDEGQFLKWLPGSQSDVEQEEEAGPVIPIDNSFQFLDSSFAGPSTNIHAQSSSDARPIEILLHDPDVWSMSVSERRILWDKWNHDFLVDVREELTENIGKYLEVVERNRELQEVRSLDALRNCDIAGFTTTGCAKYQNILRSLRPSVVICEEAGEVLEGHLLASLSEGTRHVILIGDHLQLRPKVAEYSLSRDSGVGFDLDVSLFERVVQAALAESESHSPDLAQRLNEAGILCTLQTQRRMAPNIANLLRATLYPRLRDDATVRAYPPVRGLVHNLYFLDHDHLESQDAEELSISLQSYFNKFEAEMVVELARYLILQGYRQDHITILTPYAGQLLLIRRLLTETRMILYELSEGDKEDLEKLGEECEGDDTEDESFEQDNAKCEARHVSVKERVRLSTVDNYQGEEARVVIISTVRNNRNGRTGFLKFYNRVNVMISRAQHGMFILGSKATVRRCRTAEMFNKVLDRLEDDGRVGNALHLRCVNHPDEKTLVQSAEDFRYYAPDGGCRKPCGFRLLCGHACHRMCHPDKESHQSNIMCREPCTRLLPCGHPCKMICSAPCECTEELDIVLPCTHVARRVSCSQAKHPERIECHEIVSGIAMPLCQHIMSLTCSQARKLDKSKKKMKKFERKPPDVIFSCTERCGARLPCGHPCQRPCGECTYESCLESMEYTNKRTHHAGPCQIPCDRPLLCGHLCGKPCHKPEGCPSCSSYCTVSCSHSKCDRVCSELCPICCEECGWKCGTYHEGAQDPCPLPCGSPCTRLPCDRRCSKLLDCGHRCPCVCGEDCPSPEYCMHCASENVKDQVVDLIMQAAFCDHNPDESPLIVLSCGHVFTMETLDGQFNLNRFYKERDDWPEGNAPRWVGILPVSSISNSDLASLGLRCPNCRTPMHGIHRYGRVLNTMAIRHAERKLKNLTETKEAELSQQISRTESAVDALSADKSKKDQPKATNQLRREVNWRIMDCRKAMKNFKSPTERVCELGLAWYKREGCKLENPEIDLDYPKHPSVQSQVILSRLLLRTLVLKIRFLCSFCHYPEKGRKKGKEKEDSNNSQLKAIDSCLVECEELVKKLLVTCRNAKLAATAEEVRLDEVKLQLAVACGLGDVQLPKEDFRRELREKTLHALEKASAALREVKAEKHVQVVSALNESIERLQKRMSGDWYEPVSFEEKRAIFEVMGAEVGTGATNFGGHWYTCPNGHIYTIGECGGAMQTSTCPECGATIGGGGHQLLEGNQAAIDFVAEMRGVLPDPNWREID